MLLHQDIMITSRCDYYNHMKSLRGDVPGNDQSGVTITS